MAFAELVGRLVARCTDVVAGNPHRRKALHVARPSLVARAPSQFTPHFANLRERLRGRGLLTRRTTPALTRQRNLPVRHRKSTPSPSPESVPVSISSGRVVVRKTCPLLALEVRKTERRGPCPIELARDVVEQQQRTHTARLAHDLDLGRLERQDDRAVLTLRRDAARRLAAEGQREVIAVGTRRRRLPRRASRPLGWRAARRERPPRRGTGRVAHLRRTSPGDAAMLLGRPKCAPVAEPQRRLRARTP